MSSYTIKVNPTTNTSIVKFEADQFLVKNTSYEFHNIDEAKPSPLAQQLFYLPFVKTVYISQNFIAIERYDIVEWVDVQDEVAQQIEDYLNGGSPLLNDHATGTMKKVPVTVYAEATPNPTAMKFVANKKLTVQSQEFKTISDTSEDSLARALFQFPFIKEFYVDENYISILRHDIVSWEDVTHEIRSFIKESLEKGKEVGASSYKSGIQMAAPGAENAVVDRQIQELDEVSKKIVEILDEYIKPAVASDGGNIVFDSYDEKNQVVNVVLQGACSGCPSSTMTLRNGIETMLKDMIPNKINSVIAING
ncbi:MAG: NifU family protein [Nonlabens sp.]